MNNDPQVYGNVQLGKNPTIEEQCIIGLPCVPSIKLETIIGADCLLRSGTYIYEGNKIGDNFNSGNRAIIRESNQIGNNVSIGTMTTLGHNIVIEDNVRIHSQCFICEFSIIKKNAWIGPGVFFTNSKFPNQKDSKDNLQAPVVEENAIIGANVTILPNVTIGRKSIIGAGSIVTKNVPENKIFAGNPAIELIKK